MCEYIYSRVMKHISYLYLLQLKTQLSLWKELYPLTQFHLNHVTEYMNIVTAKREHELPFIAG